MKRVCARLLALGVVALMLPIGSAYGQVPPPLPPENHYKVYRVDPGISIARPVGLTDQFGHIEITSLYLDRFANPTEKIHNGQIWPMIDPLAHQTWWRIMYPQPERTVIGIDQFGYGPVRLGNAVYLLNPALKNVQPPTAPPLPLRNHYLCYEVVGSQPLLKTVILYDQWGTADVVVLRSKLFCNPVEKRDANGLIYPIIDHRAHLQCYDIQAPFDQPHVLSALDQFGFWNMYAYQSDCLCVPALKEHIVGTKPSTWGQIKALYN